MLILGILTLTTSLKLTHCATIVDPKKCTSYPCLIFDEPFTELDLSVWEHHETAAATGNNEFQYYTNNRTNSYVDDGTLYIRPTLTNDTFDDDFLYKGTLNLWGSSPWTTCTSNLDNGCRRTGSANAIINPVQSASLRTAHRFSFKYGKVEVKAKMPSGDWLWPAIWLMPKYNAYGGWPSSGEIDIAESRGNQNLTNGENDKSQVGNKRVAQSLHWGPYFPENGHPKTFASRVKEQESFATSYHRYGLRWTKDYISFLIDDSLSFNVSIGDGGFWKFGQFDKMNLTSNPWRHGTKMAPFDQEFFLILNVAVGGTNRYFHEAFRPQIPWDNDSDGQTAMKDFWEARDKWLPTWEGDQVAMKVDYVKVWKMES